MRETIIMFPLSFRINNPETNKKYTYSIQNPDVLRNLVYTLKSNGDHESLRNIEKYFTDCGTTLNNYLNS